MKHITRGQRVFIFIDVHKTSVRHGLLARGRVAVGQQVGIARVGAHGVLYRSQRVQIRVPAQPLHAERPAQRGKRKRAVMLRDPAGQKAQICARSAVAKHRGVRVQTHARVYAPETVVVQLSGRRARLAFDASRKPARLKPRTHGGVQRVACRVGKEAQRRKRRQPARRRGAILAETAIRPQEKHACGQHRRAARQRRNAADQPRAAFVGIEGAFTGQRREGIRQRAIRQHQRAPRAQDARDAFSAFIVRLQKARKSPRRRRAHSRREAVAPAVRRIAHAVEKPSRQRQAETRGAHGQHCAKLPQGTPFLPRAQATAARKHKQHRRQRQRRKALQRPVARVIIRRAEEHKKLYIIGKRIMQKRFGVPGLSHRAPGIQKAQRGWIQHRH